MLPAVLSILKLMVKLREQSGLSIKELLKKNEDPYLAMLVYRSTPFENGYSLLMGCKLRTTVRSSDQVPTLSDKFQGRR